MLAYWSLMELDTTGFAWFESSGMIAINLEKTCLHIVSAKKIGGIFGAWTVEGSILGNLHTYIIETYKYCTILVYYLFGSKRPS